MNHPEGHIVKGQEPVELLRLVLEHDLIDLSLVTSRSCDGIGSFLLFTLMVPFIRQGEAEKRAGWEVGVG